MRLNRTKTFNHIPLTMHAYSHQFIANLKFVLCVALALTVLGLFTAFIHH
jgi:hypothetical protein